MANNVFSTLSRYTFRQEENYLTEALVYLLNLILEKEEQIGLAILSNLCGENTASWMSDSEKISIKTQFSTEKGIPDIVINAGDGKLVLIEVKHDSSLGEGQLESYHAYLEGLQAKYTQLVLLTRSRHSIQETNLDRNLFHHVCWYEINGWLSEADSHQVEFIFDCSIKGGKIPQIGTSPDVDQIDVDWISLQEIMNFRLYPKAFTNILVERQPENKRYLGDVN